MQLKDDLASTLEWRANKAAEYPADPRNSRAVEILRHLIATADDLSPELLAEYNAVFLRWDTHEVCMLHNEALRAVGFHSHPADAAEFVRHFVQIANSDRRRFENPRLVSKP
jgi:hypothetical protein